MLLDHILRDWPLDHRQKFTSERLELQSNGKRQSNSNVTVRSAATVAEAPSPALINRSSEMLLDHILRGWPLDHRQKFTSERLELQSNGQRQSNSNVTVRSAATVAEAPSPALIKALQRNAARPHSTRLAVTPPPKIHESTPRAPRNGKRQSNSNVTVRSAATVAEAP